MSVANIYVEQSYLCDVYSWHGYPKGVHGEGQRKNVCVYIYVDVMVTPCVFMKVDMDSWHSQDWLLMEHFGGPVAYLLDLVYRMILKGHDQQV